MGDFLIIPCLNCIKISQKQAWRPLIYFAWMKSMYFREYVCRFSRKSHYFCILGVSHLKPESDPPNTCTSGDKTPRTISPDRVKNAKIFCRDGTADKSVPCFALNDLSINQISNEATHSITVDMDMTQEPNMAVESDVSKPKDFKSDLKNLRYCNPKNMIIGHINVNSIRNKFDPIHSILQNGLCDIFALSETKLDESFPTAPFHITNFVLHRKDRNAHGGGVITYIRSDLPHRRRFDIELNINAIELIILEVQLYKKENGLYVHVTSHRVLKIVCLKKVSANC